MIQCGNSKLHLPYTTLASFGALRLTKVNHLFHIGIVLESLFQFAGESIFAFKMRQKLSKTIRTAALDVFAHMNFGWQHKRRQMRHFGPRCCFGHHLNQPPRQCSERRAQSEIYHAINQCCAGCWGQFVANGNKSVARLAFTQGFDQTFLAAARDIYGNEVRGVFNEMVIAS